MPIWYTWCPLGDRCSKGHRQLAKGFSKDFVQQALRSHLLNSPYHSDMSEEEKEGLVLSAEYECDEGDEGGGDEAVGTDGTEVERPRSRSRSRSRSAKGEGIDDCALEPLLPQPKRLAKRDAPDPEAFASAVVQATKLVLAQERRPVPGRRGPSSSSGSSSSDFITIPKARAQHILETLSRAQAAVNQAGRIAAAAERAFEKERNIVESCSEQLRNLLDQI